MATFLTFWVLLCAGLRFFTYLEDGGEENLMMGVFWYIMFWVFMFVHLGN